MDVISFILKTQELIPNVSIIQNKYPNEDTIQFYTNNYIKIKGTTSNIDDPIYFIIKNCDYQSFRTNPLSQFIDPLEIDNVILFGDVDLGYIGLNTTTDVIFKISYESVADYLYDDGPIPDFNNFIPNGNDIIPKFDQIIPVAKNIYCFFDALVCWLEFNKIRLENIENNKFKLENLSNYYKQKSIIASGGIEYQFWRIW